MVPICPLPSDPNLEHLRKQAKRVQRAVRSGDGDALALVREFHPRLTQLAPDAPELASFSLADAQLVLARRHGFPSWNKLRRHIDIVTHYARSPHRAVIGEPAVDRTGLVDEFLRLACLNYGADDPARPARARALLQEHPDLATASIHTVAAVGEVAAARSLLSGDPSLARLEGGPHRWEPLLYVTYSRIDSTAPGRSTLEVARLLLRAGADPNAGYLWEALPSPFTALTGAFGSGEGGVNQPPHQFSMELARLLLQAGADPNDSQALYNRHWSRDDTHLELLLEFGLGRGTGGVWHARLAPAHPSPQQLVEEELRWSASEGRTSRIRLLLPHVVDVDGMGTNHPLLEGRRAYELAVLNGNTESAALLRAAGAAPLRLTLVEELRAACMRADRASVTDLTANHPGLAGQLIAWRPDLICNAAEWGRAEAVRVMAEIGFEVNPTEWVPPMHEAALNGHLDVVKALIDLGGDPTVRDPHHDATAMGWAEYGQQRHVAEYLATLAP